MRARTDAMQPVDAPLVQRVGSNRSMRRDPLGSVIKKRRKKMRKHKQRKLLKRQRHKK
ncbi:MAG: hypothetical protein CL908_14580 [Deltaproteobacteria bacterium]|nr:hypothetical protein [Deltaproteobacteria bacterium]